jgi:hypothetical protein
MRRLAVLSVVAFVAFGSSAGAMSPAKAYKNCTELRKAYPMGVAKSKAAAKKSGAKYAPSVYNANKSKDRDKDGAACES